MAKLISIDGGVPPRITREVILDCVGFLDIDGDYNIVISLPGSARRENYKILLLNPQDGSMFVRDTVLGNIEPGEVKQILQPGTRLTIEL